MSYKEYIYKIINDNRTYIVIKSRNICIKDIKNNDLYEYIVNIIESSVFSEPSFI